MFFVRLNKLPKNKITVNIDNPMYLRPVHQLPIGCVITLVQVEEGGFMVFVWAKQVIVVTDEEMGLTRAANPTSTTHSGSPTFTAPNVYIHKERSKPSKELRIRIRPHQVIISQVRGYVRFFLQSRNYI